MKNKRKKINGCNATPWTHEPVRRLANRTMLMNGEYHSVEQNKNERKKTFKISKRDLTLPVPLYDWNVHKIARFYVWPLALNRRQWGRQLRKRTNKKNERLKRQMDRDWVCVYVWLWRVDYDETRTTCSVQFNSMVCRRTDDDDDDSGHSKESMLVCKERLCQCH